MAEKRLIDAVALTQHIGKWIDEAEACDGISPFIVASTLKQVRDLIDATPTESPAVELSSLWSKTAEYPPTVKNSAYGCVIAMCADAKAAKSAQWDFVADSPDLFPYWMPFPKPPKEAENEHTV